LSGDPYSLDLGQTYDDPLNNTLTMAINSTDFNANLELYQDDFLNSNWYLDDVSEEMFSAKPSEINNYLTEGSTLQAEWDYAETTDYTDVESINKIRHHNGSWYMVDYFGFVHEYDENFISTGPPYDISANVPNPLDMRFNDDDGYWYILNYYDVVYKYYDNWTYTEVSYPVSGANSYCMGYQDGYWYIQDDGYVYKYYDNWTYTEVSYPTYIDSNGVYHASDINYFDGYWYASTGGDAYVGVHKFDSNWVQVEEFEGIFGNEFPDYVSSFYFYDGYWYSYGDSYHEVSKYTTGISSISKFYQGNGYIYMQTNTTEILNLKSETFSPIEILENDYFSIDLQSTAPDIELQLLNGGSIVKVLSVLTNNVNYNSQTIIVPIDEDITYDQLMFTGTLDDTEYFKVYDINAIRPVIDLRNGDTDFQKIKLEYKYLTPSTSEWTYYDTFEVDDNLLAPITWNILNLRDDKISFRFTLYDNLENNEILSNLDYWIIKDFNNHLEFTVEGLSNGYLYALDQDNMINLDLKVIPVGNDITSVVISTNYETFTFTDVLFEQDHIFFEDHDINLTSALYN
ncbi:hypothetical protein LCGC14_2318310, partial [marine sediment metagenome]